MNRWMIVLSVSACLGCEAEKPAGVRMEEHEAERLEQPVSLEGVWKLRLVNDTVFDMTKVYGYIAAQPRVEFLPKENRIGGFSGCNGFGGTAYYKEEVIEVPEPLTATQMGCGGNIWENDFFNRLEHMEAYEISGDQLTVKSEGDKSMVFTRRVTHPLEENKWRLHKVDGVVFDMRKVYGNDPQPVISFNLDDDTIGGWNGCNHFGLQIELKRTYFTTGMLHSDARGCYEGWLEKFYGILGDNKRFEIVDGVLLLQSHANGSMEFIKEESDKIE